MPSDVAIEARGLTRSFGKRPAIIDLDITVNTGDIYGFLGPNGAGKTTAIRCLTGLIPPDRGTMKVFGNSDLVAAREHIGAIVETPNFHGWMSGRGNLEQAAAYAGMPRPGAEIDRVLERVGLKERAQDRAGAYSLGMRQRLGIARALLGKPRLLILDEPTNGLDPRGMHEVRELVRSLALNDDITVLISSHLLAEVQAICNRVGILQEGRLRAEGDVASLLAQGATHAIVEIATSDAPALDAALEALEGVENTGPGSEGRIRVLHPGMGLAELNKALVERGVPIEAFVPLRRGLEEVFLEVTT